MVCTKTTNFEITRRCSGSVFCLFLHFFSFFDLLARFCFLSDWLLTSSAPHCGECLELGWGTVSASWPLTSDFFALLSPALAAFVAVAPCSESCSANDWILDLFLFLSFLADTCSSLKTRFLSGFVRPDTSSALTVHSDFTSENSVERSSCGLICRSSFDNHGFSPSLNVRRLFAAGASSLDSATLSLARRFLPTQV